MMKYIKLYENYDSYPVTDKMIKDVIETVDLRYTSVEHCNFLDIFGVYGGKEIDTYDILWNELSSASGRIHGLIINIQFDLFKIYTDDLLDVLRTPINFMESYGYEYKFCHVRKSWGAMHYFKTDESLIEFIDKKQDGLNPLNGDKHILRELAFYFKNPV